MKKSIILFSSLTILLFTLFPAAHSFAVKAGGLETTASHAGLTIKDKPEAIIGNLIGTTLSIIGVIFFILMVYAGFKWMTARGNEEGVKEAQKTRQVVELYRKYNFKGEFSISSWVSDEFLKCDPELIQMIKDSRMPPTGLQDQHLPFVIERTRDVS